MEKCETCDYWIKTNQTAEDTAQCHAMPPTVVLQAFAVDAKGNRIESPLQGIGASIVLMPQMYWPLTIFSEGCGLHLAKTQH